MIAVAAQRSQGNRPKLLHSVADQAGMLPPHSLEAEEAVLDHVMTAGTVAEVRDLIAVVDWYSNPHALIWQACLELDREGAPIDLVTVADALRRADNYQRAGGSKRLAELTDTTPAHHNVREHALVVARLARRRRMIDLAHRMAAEGYGAIGSEQEWLQDCERRVCGIAREEAAKGAVCADESVNEALSAMAEVSANRGQITGLSTGLRCLDDATAGLHGGDLTVLTAKTGGGKTALACDLARAVAEASRGVAFFSVEMPHRQLTTRMVCAVARVNWHRVRTGNGTPTDHGNLIGAGRELAKLPLRIDRDRDVKIRQLVGRAERMAADFKKAETPLGLVIVDYIQLLDGRDEVGPRDNRERELAKCARMLVELAERLDVPVLALAQLNDEGLVRECRAIGFEASGLWDLQVDKREASDPEPSSAVIKISKQRHAPAPVSVACWFHQQYVTFSDGDW